MSSDLQPCPFCGGGPNLSFDTQFRYAVRCTKCGAYGPWMRRAADALRAWNSNHRREKFLRMLVGQLLFRIENTMFLDFGGKLKADVADVRKALNDEVSQ